MNYFKDTRDERGIVTLTFDTPGSRVNVLCFDALHELGLFIEKIGEDKTVKALLIESAKEDIFIAGADINEIKRFEDEAQMKEKLHLGQQIFNRLEMLPFVTISVIDGACLGGGLELAMACDYRIASNETHTRIGLVEVSLGIIPGLGGTQRLPRLVGFAKAIELIAASKRLKADKALKLGLVDASVPGGYLGFKKEAFIREIVSGERSKRSLGRYGAFKWYERFAPARALITYLAHREVLKRTHRHYPAPLKVIEVLADSAGMSMEEGLVLEREAFAPLASGETAKNLIELFFTSESLKKETFSSAEPSDVSQAAVVGVGTMGAGIAWAFVNREIPVRLAARKMESIAKAVAKIMAEFQRIRKRGRLDERQIGLKMDRITYTTQMEGLDSVDVVIEAVSEDLDVKRGIYRTLETHLKHDAIIATNTSSLQISSLAKEMQHPERFIGMHFFNPVSRMPLVEVIAGEKTDERTVATAVGLAKRLGKTPIRVGECAGFLVNRVLLPYLNESARMFEEGVSIVQIEEVMLDFGMPMGPFTLADEVGLDIGEKVSQILYEAYGERMKPAKILAVMSQEGFLGKKSGSGFFIHKGRKKEVNTALETLQHTDHVETDMCTIRDRAVLIMLNEAVRALEENIVDNARYLDMAMVMGTGFPAFRGGLMRYADNRGMAEILKRLKEFQQRYGERFKPAALLVAMARDGRRFYTEER